MLRKLITLAVNLAFILICLAPAQAEAQADTAQIAGGEGYYLRIYGAGQIVVTDAHGNSNVPTRDRASSLRVPGVDLSQDEKSARLILRAAIPPGESYTLTFPSTDKPTEIEIIRGVGNAPGTASQIIRYLDLNLPAGTNLMLEFTPNGVEDLRYDEDGDGTFETTVRPTASATGPAAQDYEAPDITFSEEGKGPERLITINAEDKESGVMLVRYSLDGRKYQSYTAPVNVDACHTRTIHAIADDNIGNRSGDFTYEIANLPSVKSCQKGSRPKR